MNNSKKSLWRKMLVIVLITTLLFTSGNMPFMASAFATGEGDDGDLIAEVISVSMVPYGKNSGEKETFPIGTEGTFLLDVQVSDSNNNTPIKTRIKLPAEAIPYILDFAEDTVADDAGYKQYHHVNYPAIKLIVPDSGEPYLSFSFRPGSGVSGATISFKMPNGTGKPMTIAVNESDIEVEGFAAGDERVNKKWGTIEFTGSFDWGNVSKSANADSLGVSSADLPRDIVYTVENINRTYSVEEGSVFTKNIEMKDTLTLPSFVTFDVGDDQEVALQVETSQDTVDSNLKIFQLYYGTGAGRVHIGTIHQDGGADNVVVDVESAVIKKVEGADGKTRHVLSFNYNQRTNLEETPSLYDDEMVRPRYTFTLDRTAVTVDLDKVTGDEKITNKVFFNATGWNDEKITPSEATTEVTLTKPKGELRVEKSAAKSYDDDNNMIIDYTITVTNMGNVALSNVRITDTLNQNLILLESDGATVSGNTLTWTIPSIGVGADPVTKNIRVKVDPDKVASGVIKPTDTLLNVVTAIADNADSKRAEVLTAYLSPVPDITIDKKARGEDGKIVGTSESQKVVEGDMVTYTITITNGGAKAEAIKFRDQLEPYIEDATISGYVMKGSNKQNITGFTKTQSADGTLFELNTTLDSGAAAYITITGRVKDGCYDQLSNLLKIIHNTAYVEFANDGVAEANADFAVKKRTPDFTIKKEKETNSDGSVKVEKVGGTEGKEIYKYGFTLRLKNVGDDYLNGDGGYVKDTMSGGLQPLAAISGTTGTISGKLYFEKEEPVDVTGTWTKTGESTYEIIWSFPKANPADPSSGDREIETAKGFYIEYDGFIDMDNFPEGALRLANVTNVASTWKNVHSGTITIPMKPIISIDKKITKINGVTLDTPIDDHYDVEAKDKVTYTLTVKNTGALGCDILIEDVLPGIKTGSSFKWEDNVVYKFYRNGVEDTSVTHSADSTDQKYVWGKIGDYIYIEAGEVITIEMTLRFGSSVTEYESAFDATSTTENKFHVVFTDNRLESDGNGKTEWEDKVTHGFFHAEAGITKTIEKNKTYFGGEDVVFHLDGFGTDHPLDDFILIDQLPSKKVGANNTPDYVTFKELYTGKYTAELVDDDNQPRSTYSIAFEAEDGSRKTVNDVSKDGQTITYDSLGFPAGTKIARIYWQFGNVNSLKIETNPTVTTTVLGDSFATSVENIGGVSWNNGTKTKSDSAIFTVAPADLLSKTSDKVGDDSAAVEGFKKVSEGDKITYTIKYTDYRATAGNPSDASDIVFTDYLTTKGLKAGTYDVEYAVYDKNDVLKVVSGTEYKLTDSLQITQQDIESLTAKKTVFDAHKNKSWVLAQGDYIKITYTVEVGSGIKDSQYDYNQELYKNWGYDEDGNVTNNPDNMAIVHNRVVVTVDGTDLVSDSDFFYEPGANKILMRKSVLGFGIMGRDWSSATVYGGKYGEDYGTVHAGDRPDNPDLTRWGESLDDGRHGYDAVRYGMIIANDNNSTESFTIESVVDNLPVNAASSIQLWKSNGTDGNIDASGKLNISGGGKTMPISAITGDGNVLNAGGMGSEACGTSVSYNNELMRLVMENLVSKTPENSNQRTDFSVDTTEGTSTNTLTLRDAAGGEKLTLAPGEFVIITYTVQINRSDYEDPDYWRNVATVNISSDKEFAPVSDLEQYQIRPGKTGDPGQSGWATSTDYKATKRNDGDLVKIDRDSFSSTVDIYSDVLKVGIEKTAAAKISGTFDENTTLTDVTDTLAENPSARGEVRNLQFFDLVEWNVNLECARTATLSGYELIDNIPYPYEIITEKDDKGTVIGFTEEGEKVYGTVEKVNDAITGEVGQNVTFDTSAGGSLELVGETPKTIKLYTRYASNSLITSNYINKITIKPDGEFTITKGSKVEEDGTIVGVEASDVVRPINSLYFNSVKSITSNTDAKGTVSGEDEENNTVTVEYQGEKVMYTLRINNNNSKPMKNLVIIDRLPQVGDTGIINTFSSRNSQFAVTMAEDLMEEYLKAGALAEWQELDIDAEPVDTEWKPLTYSDIHVTTTVNLSGFDKDSWGEGDLPSQWTRYKAEDRHKYHAVRFTFDQVGAGKKILVRFVGEVEEDAVPGEIAYNSFGYGFEYDSGKRYYAEPAKVGVSIPVTSVTGEKIWKDGGSSKRPSNADTPIFLYSKVGDETPQKVMGTDGNPLKPTWKDTEDDDVKQFTFEGLRVNENKVPIEYMVKEGNVDNYTSNVTQEDDGSWTVMNILYDDLSGTKTWKDGGLKTRPEVTLTLYRQVEETIGKKDWGTATVVEGATPQWNKDTGDSNKWTYTYSNLPKYTPSGHEISYYVEENPVDGYVSTINGLDITNTRSEVTSISIVKKWEDDNDKMGLRPDRIKVKFFANGELKETAYVSSGGSGSGGWKHTFHNLPKYDENGEEITYTVKEDLSELPADRYKTSGPETSGTDPNTYVITNTLIGSTEASFGGTKILTGRAMTEEDEFNFKLSRVNTADNSLTVLETVENTGDKFSFKSQVYTEEGTYIYKIEEVSHSHLPKGVTISDKVYYIKVVVYRDGTGALTSDTFYVEKDASDPVPSASEITKTYADEASVVFTNVYKATGNAVIVANKSLIGRPLAINEFTFKLTEVDENGVFIREVQTDAKNTAAGTVPFDAIEYDETHAGKTFYYQVEEVNTGADGVVYDGSKYTVAVRVRDNGDGTLTTDVTYPEDGITFVNTAYVGVSPTFAAKKAMVGKELRAGDFEFALTEVREADGAAIGTPIIMINKAGTVDGSGNYIGEITFKAGENIVYTSPGVFYYTLAEVKGDKGGVTYDEDSVYAVRVKVKQEDGKESLVLETSYSTFVPGKNMADDDYGWGTITAPTFNNSYDAIGQLSLKALKEYTANTGETLKANDFDFTLTPYVYDAGSGTWIADNGAAMTGKNGAVAGSDPDTVIFALPQFNLKSAGKDYYYLIEEKAGSDALISYDGAKYVYKVSVTDKGDGTLETAVTYAEYVEGNNNFNSYAFKEYATTEDGAVADKVPTFTNTKTSIADADIDFSKSLEYGDAGESYGKKDMTAGQFTFNIEAVTPGAPMPEETTVSTTDQKGIQDLTFGKIVYDAAGTYVYKIKEDIGGVTAPYTGDSNTYFVKVVVGVQDGKLVPAVYYSQPTDGTYPGDDQVTATTPPTLKNYYKATTNVAIKAKKNYVTYAGDTLVAKAFTFTLTPFDSDAGTWSTDPSKKITSFNGAITGSKADEIFFNLPTFTEKSVGKSYYYLMEEVAGSDTLITYDEKKYVIKVDVADNGNGSLKATVTYAEYEEGNTDFTGYTFEEYTTTEGGAATDKIPTFTNTKTAEGDTDIDFSKSLEYGDADNSYGNKDMTAGQFTFSIEAITAGAPMPEETNVSTTNQKGVQNLTFGKSTYKAEGTYIYKIKEDVTGITAPYAGDSNTYFAKVVVEKQDGKLVPTVYYSQGTDGTYPGDAQVTATTPPTLKNYYKATGDMTLEFNKELVNKVQTGTRNLNAGEFKFSLRPVKEDGSDLPGGTTLYATNAQGSGSDGVYTGTVTFETIEYQTPGTYYYILDEVEPEDEGGENLHGIDYDPSMYAVKVVVTDKGDGTLKVDEPLFALYGGTGELIGEDFVTAKELLNKDVLTFSNGYETGTAHSHIYVTKNMDGRSFEGGAQGDTFTFTLTAATDDTPMPGDKVGGTAILTMKPTHGYSHTEGFGDIIYHQAGTYKYTVTETKANITGVVYDESVYEVVVEVVDNHDGTLTAHHPTYTKKSGESLSGRVDAAVFTNRYYEPAEANLLLNKSLWYGSADNKIKNKAIRTGDFTFEAEALNGGPEIEAKVLQGDEDGVATLVFETISLEKVPDEDATDYYYYEITEKNKGEDGYTYDSASYYARIGVKRGTGELKLQTEVNYALKPENAGDTGYLTAAYTGATPEFNNYYEAVGKAELDATKKLTGRPLEAGEFSFRLEQVSAPAGAVAMPTQTVGNDAGSLGVGGYRGKVNFADINYILPGDYYYSLTEAEPADAGGTNLPGVVYDQRQYAVKITVTDNNDGTLTASTPKFAAYTGTLDQLKAMDMNSLSWEEKTGGVVFENSYTADGDVVFDATKKMSGKALAADDFSFKLESINVGDGEVPAVDQQKKNGAGTAGTGGVSTGKIVFDKLTYTQDDAGKNFYYRLYEEIPTEDKREAGVSYDAGVYYIKVSVADKGEGTLNISKKFSRQNDKNLTGDQVKGLTYSDDVTAGALEFKNSYVDHEFGATKSIEGTTFDGEKNFTFTLTGGSDITPMPEGTVGNTKTVKITPSSGNEAAIDFGKVYYTQAGEYTYTVKETAGTVTGMIYDKSIYTVTVKVEDKDGFLTKTVSYSKEPIGSSEVDKVEFTNHFYESTNAEIEFSKILWYGNAGGTYGKKDMTEDQFTFTLTALSPETAPMPIGTTVGTEDGLGTQSLTFGKIMYAEAPEGAERVYYYELKEDTVTAPGYTGSTDVYYVKVVVTKDEATHKLKTEVSYALKAADAGETGYLTADYTATPEFNNYYQATGNVTLGADKNLTGRKLVAGEFEFTLKQMDAEGNLLSGGTILTAKNQEEFMGLEGIAEIAFEKINYTEADIDKTYYYLMAEKEGTSGGVTYDKTLYAVKVTITDNGNGTLMVTPRFAVYNAEKDMASQEYGDKYDILNRPVFENVYKATGEMIPEAEKTLVGRTLREGEFKFSFVSVNPDGSQIVGKTDLKASNAPVAGETNSGKITFEAIKYTEEDIGKTYYYMMQEESVNPLKGITYDPTVYVVKAEIFDGMDGTLQVKKSFAEYNPAKNMAEQAYEETYDDTSKPEFVNQYKAAGQVLLTANKRLTGRSLIGGEFKFYVIQVKEDGTELDGGMALESTNRGATTEDGKLGEVIFEAITYTEEDIDETYYYLMGEKKGTSGGITYDDSLYAVRVDVTDNLDGTLNATPVFAEYDETKAMEAQDYGTSYDNDTRPQFDNLYEATGQLALTATKKLTGRPLKGEEFNFVLTQVNEAGETLVDGVVLETVNEAGKGEAEAIGDLTFEAITYTEEDIDKIYYYLMTEKEENGEGVVYDSTTYAIKVVVTDNIDGTLKATPTFAEYDNQKSMSKQSYSSSYDTDAKPEFVNRYYAPVEANIEAKKLFLNGDTDERRAMTKGQFAFTLTAKDGAPMPQDGENNQKTVSIEAAETGEANIDFGPITYVAKGEYFYTITEEKGNNPSVEYDSDRVEVKVTVTETLEVSVEYSKVDEDYKGSLSYQEEIDAFVNRYNPPAETEAVLEIIKRYRGLDGKEEINFGDNTFRFKIEATNDEPLPEITEVTTEEKNSAEEKLTFMPITFGEDVGAEGKVYQYTITEIVPEADSEDFNPSIRYSKEVVNVEVKVVKTEKNKLAVDSIKYLNEEGEEGEPVITNIYEAPKPVEAVLKVSKLLKYETGEFALFNDDVFTFILEAVGEAPLPSNTTVSTTKAEASEEELFFDKIEFVEDPGQDTITYNYVITELVPKKEAETVTYSDEKITAKVTIGKDNNNNLTVKDIEYLLDDEAVDEPMITNVRRRLPKTSDERGGKLPIYMTAMVAAILGFAVLNKKREDEEKDEYMEAEM